jgi:hypothetical protein
LIRRYSFSSKRLDGCWYWHLYFDGERINGGLAESEAHCRRLVSEYKAQHQRGQLRTQYVWDEEAMEWISRADLGLL